MRSSSRMPSFVREGATIHYEVEGEGPPVLMIQGTGIAASGWRRQVDGLRDRYCCAVFDNRGVGRSGPADRTLSVDQMTADAGAVLGELGWSRAHVVGHSHDAPRINELLADHFAAADRAEG